MGWRGERLIPARAGNTAVQLENGLRLQAHPRSRGEHFTAGKAVFIAVGSSPLARGTRCRTRLGCAHARLIPARAGNTPSDSPRVPAYTAHPRSRGEHSVDILSRYAHFGSSPLARGTLTARRNTSPPKRLIPARAGNTARGTGSIWGLAAHPRSRGEHRTAPARCW